MSAFSGTLAIQQRVLPGYRAPFFDLLARHCSGGLALAAGDPLPSEGIPPAHGFEHARFTHLQNHHFFSPRHPFFLCSQTGLLDWLDKEDPDVLVIEANPRYPRTRDALRWMKAKGRPVLGWGLGAPALSGPLAALRMRSRLNLFRKLDGMIAYSMKGAQEYAALGVLPRERIFTAFNAVAPPPQGPPLERGPLAKPARVLFVGRLQARKRLDLLFAACSTLPERLRPLLTIVGEGPARSDFEQLAATQGLQVEFTGSLQGPELEQRFADADLFVLPGTGGLAIQEAMSHALPVIVAQGDGTQEDLVRPENGWLVPPYDAHALSAALHTALTDPDLRTKGLASRKIVVEEINLVRMVDTFVLAAQAAKDGI